MALTQNVRDQFLKGKVCPHSKVREHRWPSLACHQQGNGGVLRVQQCDAFSLCALQTRKRVRKRKCVSHCSKGETQYHLAWRTLEMV